MNKRDLASAVPVDEMVHVLRFEDEPYFETVAEQGGGVPETFSAIVDLVVERFTSGSPGGEPPGRPR